MISNTTKLERLSQAVFRYVSIKKALFSFCYNLFKVLFLGVSALLANWSASKSVDLPIDSYRQTVKKKRQHRLMLSFYRNKKLRIIGCLPCPYIPLNCILVGLKTMSVSLHGSSFCGSCYGCRSARHGTGFGKPC